MLDATISIVPNLLKLLKCMRSSINSSSFIILVCCVCQMSSQNAPAAHGKEVPSHNHHDHDGVKHHDAKHEQTQVNLCIDIL